MYSKVIQLYIYTYTYSFSDSFPLQDVEYSSPSIRLDLCCLSLLFYLFYIRCAVLSRSVTCDPLWPINSSPPGFSVRGILQARTLEWVVISYSRACSQPRDQTCASCVSCIGRQILYCWGTREAWMMFKEASLSRKIDHVHWLENEIFLKVCLSK